jgi:hypothetical protein
MDAALADLAADAADANVDASAAPPAKPGLSLNARGCLRRFELRHTWPLPAVAEGLSGSVGLRYDPDLQERGGGLLQQLGLAGPGGAAGAPADGAQIACALVWRSQSGLSRLSVSDAEAAAKRGWRFAAGPVTGVLGAEVRYPLLGVAAPRRDPATGLALARGAPELPRELVAGSPTQRQRAPKVSFSVDDVRPLWAYAAAVGAAVLLGAPVSLTGQSVSVGLPGGTRPALPRRLSLRARGSARHRGWLSYALDVDELGGALEVGPLLKLGGLAAAKGG